ncbi:LLM class flavin-dependent oxidoreductase [Rhodococcus sp. BP-252]|uniref:Monooxygenase n=1 Tax=Rhodococcoides kyotonense TaxID=398843 RepID=A0A177Y825_9NOCA|nr:MULTISPECIES: LLM class flavin-dependent oxidoreductase [Rhodococcus]MBY6414310.1 LLM class flavin-dependent oxidoreductase [Rhodococcus sp. BP-320]MBY6419080.1 LLM class flavin-dependent oxidoreductase [Rhodococcus sp. BP-321]MBY6423829.1 LLM class flavin-dependent oxidoreductase [Rhodococcus sp. BP-324]MBY6429213.1 LLM class flavin-dependent oxidoreductase [Rhodococcus sp. BP-323]MBY6434120.1 LLM class flavin-dependent oxidoreductase [Rhodococcus sp. BP-322]
MTERKQLHLNAFLMGVGHHEAAWRHPRTDAHKVLDVEHFQDLARLAERGKLDSVFFADNLATGPRVKNNAPAIFEPITLLTAMATVTSHVGLIATASTGYNEPFTLARKFTSLDHISGGRAGWNIVTSGGVDEAANFGYDEVPDHAGRYDRAAEFVDVATALWNSWEPDALVLDEETGTFADADKVRTIDHVGDRFAVRGPLNSPRSVQGRPLLVQAGSSESGKNFAARYAEAVFTAQRTLVEGQQFYSDLKARLASYGRGADDLKVLPGIVPYLASTEAEARALEAEFTDLISPEYSLRQLSWMLGTDLSAHSLDEPLPTLPPIENIRGNKSRYQLVKNLAESGNLTVRQLIGLLGGGRGHRTFTGTPEQLADELELWFDGGAADGFNIMPPFLPGGLELFVDHVVPILQRRGLFRTDYTEKTLRGHYGLTPLASPTSV